MKISVATIHVPICCWKSVHASLIASNRTRGLARNGGDVPYPVSESMAISPGSRVGAVAEPPLVLEPEEVLRPTPPVLPWTRLTPCPAGAEEEARMSAQPLWERPNSAAA